MQLPIIRKFNRYLSIKDILYLLGYNSINDIPHIDRKYGLDTFLYPEDDMMTWIKTENKSGWYAGYTFLNNLKNKKLNDKISVHLRIIGVPYNLPEFLDIDMKMKWEDYRDFFVPYEIEKYSVWDNNFNLTQIDVNMPYTGPVNRETLHTVSQQEGYKKHTILCNLYYNEYTADKIEDVGIFGYDLVYDQPIINNVYPLMEEHDFYEVGANICDEGFYKPLEFKVSYSGGITGLTKCSLQYFIARMCKIPVIPCKLVFLEVDDPKKAMVGGTPVDYIKQILNKHLNPRLLFLNTEEK